jgi:hypothetical protein
VPSIRHVLIVIRTATTLWWLSALTESVFGDDVRVRVSFTLDDSSVFSAAAASSIRAHGGRFLSWTEATARSFDLAIASSHRGRLDELRSPLLIVPHGPGFTKKIALATRGHAPQPQTECTPKTIVAVTHPSQARFWSRESAEIFVAGDPCLDALLASASHRDEYRRAFNVQANQRLVLVSSTWGSGSLLHREPHLFASVASELPASRYRIGAVLHPNIWSMYGDWQLRVWFREALRLGMMLIPPRGAWRAAVVAADFLLGDHGSVSWYAHAIGLPVMLAATGGSEVVPGTAAADLVARAPLWRAGPALLAEIERSARTEPPNVDADVAMQGCALQRYREVIYQRLHLQAPTGHVQAVSVDMPTGPLEAHAWWT